MGKQFAFPIKKKLPRAKRGKARENVKNLSALFPGGIAVKPMVKQSVNIDEKSDSKELILTTVVGEQLCTDYQLHELPSDSGECFSESLSTSTSALTSDILSTIDTSSTLMLLTDPCNTEVLVYTALLARMTHSNQKIVH